MATRVEVVPCASRCALASTGRSEMRVPIPSNEHRAPLTTRAYSAASPTLPRGPAS